MSSDASMRAGDADRDRTIGILREAFAEGRLTEAEFNQRLDAANAARTFGDLAPLTTDLPVGGAAASGIAPPSPVAVPRPAPDPVPRTDGRRKSLRAGWASWAGVSVLVTVIWLLTVITSGEMSGFWPIWVIGPWGAVMLMATIMGSGDE